MRRREILVVAVSATLLVFGPVGAFAQLEKLKGTTPEQRAAIETEFMKTKLSLTRTKRVRSPISILSTLS
jgi:hypothetical protein